MTNRNGRSTVGRPKGSTSRTPYTRLYPPDLPGIPPELGSGPGYEALAVHLSRKRDEEGPRPTAEGTPFRGSMARGCARRIAFEALGVEPAIEIGTETLVTFDIGRMYHEVIQTALVEKYEAHLEVKCSWQPDHLLSGHADAVYTYQGQVVAVEIKSMKAFAWQMAIEGNPYDHTGAGPKLEHLVQAGLYACSPSINADAVHMIYVNKDTGQLAEWIIGVHQPLVHLGEKATTVYMAVHQELDRMGGIWADLAAGMMPARDIPGYGVVNHQVPEPTSKDKPWNCRYCAYQPHCKTQPPDAFSLEVTPWSLPSPPPNSST